MATLEEIARKNKKLGLHADAGVTRRMLARANNAVWAIPSNIAALPATGAKNMLAGMVLGPKNNNPTSPAFGQRFHSLKGDRKYKQITKAEYDAIQSGEKAGKAMRVKSGPLGSIYMKQRFQRGGLVGFAQKHPLMAAGGGLLAYYLLNNKGARDATGAVAAGMKPDFQTAPTGEVQKQWAQPSFQNPLAGEVWGK